MDQPTPAVLDAASLPDNQKVVPREAPQPPEARAALVKKLTARIKADKAKWQPYFDMMVEDQAFAYGLQYPGQADLRGEQRYVANIVQRHIKSQVAKLYAKNPKVVAQRRRRLDFAIWDETPQQLQMAIQTMQTAFQAMQDPAMAAAAGPAMQAAQQAQELIQDVSNGVAQRKMLDKVGRTLEILFEDGMRAQTPDLRLMMKQLVRRTSICSVGYVKLGYQRALAPRPGREAELSDITNRLAAVKRLQAEAADKEIQDYDAEAEELRLALQQLQSEPDMIVREGLVFDFPLSNRVIPAASMRYVGVEGFVGAPWVSEEYMLTPDRILEVYKVDVGKSYTPYSSAGVSSEGKSVFSGDYVAAKRQSLGAVWEHYDSEMGLVYTICDGWPDFLDEPRAPNIETPQFHPFFPLAFNQLEDSEHAFPVSDVRLLRSIQREYNRSREALRQHRIASRPLYATAAGALESEDAYNLATHEAHEVLQLAGLKEGQKAADLIQPIQKVGIDPNVYDTNSIFQDASRVVGSQESDLGPARGQATATETSNAEAQRITTLASNQDDLDSLLTLLSRCAGQVLLKEISPDTVKQVVGPGSVWPQFTHAELVNEIWLEIEAGSSGRPNQAQDIANFERLAPWLIQTPGINPQWLLKYQIKILDARIDLTDAFLEGMPSIVAMNGMKQMSTGQPTNDPNQQGDHGGQNAQGVQGPGPQPGPQAAHPVAGAPPGGPALPAGTVGRMMAQ